MLSTSDVEAVVNRITYRDFIITVEEHSSSPCIRVRDPRAPRFGRCWLIMPQHDASDVVRTTFAAISLVEEHERREFFLVDGEMVWDPHRPVL